MTRWAMVADLRRCVGCQTCTAACKHANTTPPNVQWRSVLDLEVGAFPDVRRVFLPVGCMHCDDPPCVEVCPSTATRKRDDGIVTMDYDLCIGCASCAVACPYQARFKVTRPSFSYGRDKRLPNEAKRFDPARRGVAQKCTFCVDRIDGGLRAGLTPGSDPEATPACVNSCIADALHFGDLDDPDSKVSRLLQDNRSFVMHEELGTGPNIHYLWAAGPKGKAAGPLGAEKSNQSFAEASTGSGAIGGVAPWRQQHWDWRAAGNFICGGSGTGLLVASLLAIVLGLSPYPFALAGLALIGSGLACVWAETGRPLRAPFNVLFHPQRSWMSREAILSLAIFPLVLASVWFQSEALLLSGAVAGAGFLHCQAWMLLRAKGIPAWREPAILPLIVLTGLTEGLGLFLVVAAALQAGAPSWTAALGTALFVSILLLALLALRAWAWLAYRRTLAGSAPEGAISALTKLDRGFLLLGHGLPALLLVGALPFQDIMPFAAALAGLFAALAGWVLKHTIVTGAAFTQGFAITHTPERGGRAGGGAKPGWSLQR